MNYATFLLLTATLFVRPAEIFTALKDAPIYLCLMLVCLAANGPRMVRQFLPASLNRHPISTCVIGMLLSVAVSHLTHGLVSDARAAVQEFGKPVVYFLLLLCVIDSQRRLVHFLKWLLLCIVVVAGLALLQFHGVTDIPALKELQQHDAISATGEVLQVRRLRSTGIFNDPNDLSMILLLGMTICGAGWSKALGTRLPRTLWLPPMAICGYALALTRSRGGFIAMLVGLTVLLTSRYGWRKTLPLAALLFPLLLVLFAGRMTRISADEDTGQARIQLWSDGLEMFRQSPLFGIGYGTYQDHAGLVAHNSYVHCFTELGLLGGTMFFGALAIPMLRLRRLGDRKVEIRDPRLRVLRPFLLAMLSAFAASMITLTRCYVEPTYLVIGLAAAFLELAVTRRPLPRLRFNYALVSRLATASMGLLAAAYVFVRVFARWN